MPTSDDKPPFFVAKETKRGTLHYWQPSAAMRKQGHRPRRLSDDHAAALRECAAVNAENERQKHLPSVKIRPGSVSWLIHEFKENHRYRTKEEKTRKGYRQNLDIIERVFGAVPVTQITRPVLEAFYNKMHKRTPWQANAVMTMFRRILFFAVALGIITTNPASKMEMAGNPPREQKWEDDDLDAFLSVAKARRRSIWLATILAAELGQRQGDILGLRREDLEISGFHVRQNKGGVVVEVPCSARLREALQEIPADPGFLVISETTGRPYQSYNFTHVFAEIRAAAKVRGDLRFQDLRRTCVVNLARAGCTPPEIAAVTGHKIDTVVDILETYLPRDAVVAANAIAKLDRWRSERSKRRRRQHQEVDAEDSFTAAAMARPKWK